jgi:hypothetical protein
MSNDKIWENPDPGVKWALDLLKPDPDYEEISILERYKLPMITTVTAGVARITQLALQRRPIITGLHFSVAFVGLSMAVGKF